MSDIIVNHADWILIVLGVVFLIAEAFVFSFGVLGITGFIAFMVGIVMLLNINGDNLIVALPLIITIGLVFAIFLGAVVYLAVKARRRPLVSGREKLLGSVATVVVKEGEEPKIHHKGELWQVKAKQPLHDGQKVKIYKIIDKLVLEVEPVIKEEQNG